MGSGASDCAEISAKSEKQPGIYQLGLSYLAQGSKDKASEMSARLKRLDPGQAELLRRLIR
jgi:hypothetical protein